LHLCIKSLVSHPPSPIVSLPPHPPLRHRPPPHPRFSQSADLISQERSNGPGIFWN
jgi:hypothetical protein